MGLYRDENGVVVEMDDNQASMQGYQPVSTAEQAAGLEAQGLAARGEERGVVGTINAAATGAASGLTLGASDYVLSKVLSDGERERAAAEVEAHPTARLAGEIGGAVLGGFAAPGSALARTPAGYLSSVAAREVEAGLATGGTARALVAMGTEGALQNAGQYIGMSALRDTDLTVEGAMGALGTGFAFGAGGGAAALGVSKGTIAARRLFSKSADGGAEALQDISQAWSRKSQEVLEADSDNVLLAKRHLEEIRAAKAEAKAARQQADLSYANEQARAAKIASERPVRETLPPEATPIGEKFGPGELYGPSEPTGGLPRPGHETYGPYESYGPTELIGPRTEPPSGIQGQQTQVLSRETLDALKQPRKATRAGEVAATEAKGAGLLSEGADVLSEADIPYEAKASARFAVFGEELPWEVEWRETADMLGDDIAKQEADLTEALEEFHAARKDLMEKVADVPKEAFGDVVPFDFGMPSQQAAQLADKTGAGGPAALRRGVQRAPQTEYIGEALPPIKPTEPAPAFGRSNVPRGEFDQSAGPQSRYNALEQEYEAALAKAHNSDPAVAQAAAQHADELEAELAKMTGPDNLLADVASAADVISRYEKASAKLADALGDAAHPTSRAAADALSEAESEALRKHTDRTAQALEDAEQYGPYDYAGPREASTKERLAYARSRKADARAAYVDVAARESEAKRALDLAKANDTQRKAIATISLPEPKMRKGAPTAGGKAVDAAAAVELLNIPGLPSAASLPVVGPLLAAWLKFRGVKALMSRFAGRIPATADAKMAALAARTRERVVTAVDRTLDTAEKVGKASTRHAPAVAGVISSRIYDDGEPDAPKGASLGEVAATRVREITAYVNTPGAIEADVRRELRGVSDPDVIASAAKARRILMEYLMATAPKVPVRSPLVQTRWQMSPAEAASFARRVQAAHDPAGEFERLEDTQALVSREAAETLRTVYPQLFAMGQQRMLMRAAQIQATLPYRQRMQLSAFFDVPLDPSLDPESVTIVQESFARKAPPQPTPSSAPPTPSVAGNTNLTALYQTSADRRAQR